jgi:hypothetical protein
MVSRGVTPAGNNSVLRTGLPRALGLTPVRALPLGRKPRQSAARLPLCILRFSFIASPLLPPPLAEHCKLRPQPPPSAPIGGPVSLPLSQVREPRLGEIGRPGDQLTPEAKP